MRAYVFVAFTLSVYYETATSLPAYSDGGNDGWSRIHSEGFWQHLMFTCKESDGWDAIVNLEDETLPWDAGALTVRNCRTVTLTLSQKAALAPLRSLTVENVNTLELVDTAVQPYQFHNPPQVEFINIGRIPRIPSRTFTSSSTIKAETIVFVNVTIDEISSRAFHSVTDASLLMDSVEVTLIDTDAINMENTSEGFVRIMNSRFGTLEPRSFVLSSREVAFVGCDIKEIREQSLEISTLNFTFHNNTVTDVMSAGFTVSAVNISFMGNHFKSLQNRAFEEVTPAGNDVTRRNVTYEFVNNYINWAEQGSLQPNFTIYEESRNQTRLQLGNNSFNCTCALVGWLDASIQEEVTPDLIFRTLILQNKDNVCADTDCRLPVRYINFLFDSTSSKSCVTSKQVQALCEHTVTMSSQPTIFSSASVVFLSVCCLAYFFS